MISPASTLVGLLLVSLPPANESKVPPSEILAFATRIEQSISAGDASFFNASFDVEAVLEKATHGVQVSAAASRGFADGFKSRRTIAEELVKGIQRGGSLKLLRIREFDGKPSALYRYLGPEQAVNYLEIVIEGDKDEEIRFSDVFSFVSGELCSVTLRRPYLEIAANENRNLVTKLVSGETEFIKYLPKIHEMTQAVQRENAQAALKVFHELPESLHRDKNILLIRFRAATMAGGEAYDEALADVEKYLKDEAGAELLLIDVYFRKGEHDKALSVIDTLDKRLGGDSYLHHLRGNVLFAAERIPEAKAEFLKAIEAERDLLPPYWALIEIELNQKHFDEVVRWLTTIEKDLGITLADLKDSAVYAEFVDSPQYTQWMKSR